MRCRHFAVVLAALLAVACDAPHPTVSPTSASSSPEAVLETYLRAWQAGDCVTAHALFPARGDMCDGVTLVGFKIDAAPYGLGDQVEAAVRITIRGADEFLPDGEHTWFYIMEKQPDGSWRLVSGGSGP